MSTKLIKEQGFTNKHLHVYGCMRLVLHIVYVLVYTYAGMYVFFTYERATNLKEKSDEQKGKQMSLSK